MLSVHQSLGFCLDRYTTLLSSPLLPLHSVWLQLFETQLWISEQRHQSQYLLIFIERHTSQRHLYNIKHLEEMGSDSLLGFFSNAFIVSLSCVFFTLFPFFFIYFSLLLSSSASASPDANPPSFPPLFSAGHSVFGNKPAYLHV